VGFALFATGGWLALSVSPRSASFMPCLSAEIFGHGRNYNLSHSLLGFFNQAGAIGDGERHAACCATASCFCRCARVLMKTCRDRPGVALLPAYRASRGHRLAGVQKSRWRSSWVGGMRLAAIVSWVPAWRSDPLFLSAAPRTAARTRPAPGARFAAGVSDQLRRHRRGGSCACSRKRPRFDPMTDVSRRPSRYSLHSRRTSAIARQVPPIGW